MCETAMRLNWWYELQLIVSSTQSSLTTRKTVSELQHFLEIQDGGVRHVGFHENSFYNNFHQQYFLKPIFTSNLVTIAQTVSELQHFLEIQDGGVSHVGYCRKSIFQSSHG
jgi:hypothetical protein